MSYRIDGEPGKTSNCSTALSRPDGSFETNLSWTIHHESSSEIKFEALDYTVLVGGVPESSVEIEQKPNIATISEMAQREIPITDPTALIKIRIKVSRSDLQVATVWHQAALITDLQNRTTILNDFLTRYSGRVSLDQAVRLAGLLQNVKDQNGTWHQYKDQFLLNFSSSNRATLSAEDKIKLASQLEFQESRNNVLGL